MTTTLQDALKRYRGLGPGFHFLRHALSFVILAHHCRVAVFGVGYDNTYAKGAAMTMTNMAGLSRGHLVVEMLRPALFALVGMFFALSGFLVAGSALRTMNLRIFFANRALRILPALSVEVLLSAFILGPVVTILPLSSYFRDGQFFRYFGNIVGHVTFRLPGVFVNNPWPNMINANLWTLPSEFWCYFIVLLLMLTGLLLKTRWLSIGIILVTAAWLILNLIDPGRYSIRSDATHFTKWYIVVMFLLGLLAFINAKRVVLHPLLFGAAAIIYYLMTVFNLLGPLSGIFLAYCTVYVGMTDFPRFNRLLKVDLSYGTYLYGFPITQGVIFYVSPLMQHQSAVVRFLLIFPAVLLLTVVFSYVSWTFIEKPALGLRRHLLREPPSVA